MKTYQLIYADPAWHFRARSDKGEDRSAKNHYDVMTVKQIAEMPVKKMSARDSVCCMWITDPMIEQGYEVMHAWGFKPKTVVLYWVKTNKLWRKAFAKIVKSFMSPTLDGREFDINELQKIFFTGLGYSTRANPEQCILGTRGAGLPRFDRGVPRLMVSPIGRHSEKPAEAAHRIERLFGEVSRVELFARVNRPGWDSWGNDVKDSITIPGIAQATGRKPKGDHKK